MDSMDLLTYTQQLLEYHYWATNRMLAAMVSLGSDQLNEPWGKGWGSLHATLTHTMNAEWIWLQRLQGTSPSGYPDAQTTPTVYDIRERWIKQAAGLRAFLAGQTAQSIQQNLTYNNTRGESFELPVWQIISHIVNHATHHRAEIAEMLAVLEVAHPEDDMYYYFLEKSGQR